MLTITPIKFNNLFNLQIKKQEQNTQKTQENSNAQMMSYPKCYYTNNIMFGGKDQKFDKFYNLYSNIKDEEGNPILTKQKAAEIWRERNKYNHKKLLASRENNFDGMIKMFQNVTDDNGEKIFTPQKYLKACRDYPKCFIVTSSGIKKVFQKLEAVKDGNGDSIITKKDFCKIALDYPQIMVFKERMIPEIFGEIKNRFADCVYSDGTPMLTPQTYLAAVKENYSLLTLPISSLRDKIDLVCDDKHLGKYKDQNNQPIVTPAKYVKACLKKPQLFTFPPEYTSENMQYLEDKFQDIKDECGNIILTPERYLQSCLKNPSLFTLNPEHIKENYDQFNSYFGDVKDENGKSINYLEAALRNPSIFTIPLDDLKQKVRLLIAAENYTYDEALQDVLKNPQSPIDFD